MITQTEKENALRQIDGYFMPAFRSESAEVRFDKAKAEAIYALKKLIQNLESIDFVAFRNSSVISAFAKRECKKVN